MIPAAGVPVALNGSACVSVAAFGLRLFRSLWRRLPPKPLKGRWGATFGCTRFVLEAGREQTEVVLRKVLGGKQRPARKMPRLEEALLGEEGEPYSEKMSRWKSTSIKAVTDILWWATLIVVNRIMKPLEDLGSSLKKHSAEHAMFTYVTDTNDKVAHRFMWLMQEESLLHTDGWAPLFEMLPVAHRSNILEDIVSQTLGVRSDFYRRIWRECVKFPKLLLWCALRPAEVALPHFVAMLHLEITI